MRIPRAVVFVALTAVLASGATAAEGLVSAEYRSLVPYRLLALLHAPEIHQELRLSTEQVRQLETLFGQIDGEWFRSRLQAAEAQHRTLDRLEEQVHGWLNKNASAEQRKRLGQLELQAQSVRLLLRRDIAQSLALTAEQQEKFASLAKTTDAAQAALQKATQHNEKTADQEKQAAAAAKAEQDAVHTVLKAGQQQSLQQMLGAGFDLSKLKRTYPMAPEFVRVDDWINSPPLTLNELRGKVVLVHFYAFQCHNCHANFPIYRRWYDQLQKKGVVVIGIQTPETALERNPDAVRTAAREKDLKFPILVDLNSANWNAWGNTMWPTVYVVDRNGYIRHWWQGELNWQGATGDKVIEQVVDQALAEPAA